MEDSTKVMGGKVVKSILAVFFIITSLIAAPMGVYYWTLLGLMFVYSLVVCLMGWAGAREKEAYIEATISKRLRKVKEQLRGCGQRKSAEELESARVRLLETCDCGRRKGIDENVCVDCEERFYREMVGNAYLTLQHWTDRAVKKGV